MTIRFGPASTAAAATTLTKQPLVIDGTLVREGVGGPVYKAVGYNTRSIPGIYASAMTLDSQAKLDDFFEKQPANSLHRMEAYAPGSGSGQTDATILAIVANTVATARKYGQRLILRTTNWTTVGSTPNVVDRFDNKLATWFTSQTYKHSVTGATSYEDWIIALLGVCGTDGTVVALDLCNEPQCSSGNAASAASYVTYMAGVIKGINPNMLVMLGVNGAGVVGGQSSYQTIIAGADFCSAHNYNSYGFPTNNDPIITVSQTLGKPVIIDEHAQFSKGYYGLSTDSDKDSNSWPAVDSEAQGREIERFIASNLAVSNCFGVLIYSWPGTQTDGLGHYEPPEGSLGRKVVRDAPLAGDGFSFESLPSISAWLDGAQNWRFAPKSAVTTWWYRHANGSNVAIPSGNAPTAGRFGTHASFRFDGTKYIDQTQFKTGSAATTGCWAIAPTIWPAAGTYAYLTGPQSSTAAASGVRINSAGQVEVIKTATGGSVNGTVVCTSTNSVDRDALNVLVWQWDTSAGTVAIYLNGTLTTATGQTASLTPGNARLGAGYDGLNGFTGHALEVIQETVYETAANIRLVEAYLQRRYKSPHAVGVPVDLIAQQVAGVAAARSTRALAAADNSFATGLNGQVASTVGTSEIPMTIGISGSRVRVRFGNSYTVQTSNVSTVDTVGGATATFKAAFRDAAGTIWPLTFAGQRTATLDGGGDIFSDPLSIDVVAGDLVFVRTFLASGSANAVIQTQQIGSGQLLGGFTATTDLTAAGSAAVTSSTTYVYGPNAVEVLPDTAARSVLLVGDSICRGTGDGGNGSTSGCLPLRPYLSSGGFLTRALTGKAGILNLGVGGDEAQYFLTQAGHYLRMRGANLCNYAVLQFGTNDIFLSSRTAAQLQADLLSIAKFLRRYGIVKTFVITIVPQTTSPSTFWLDLAGQTVKGQESARTTHNNWARAGGPIDPVTLAPVAAGTAGALQFGNALHPIAGYFETADVCESARDSGKWKAPVRTVTDGVTTSGSGTVTSATAAFVNAQVPSGDVGRLITIPGAGTAGAVFQNYLKTVSSGTSIVMQGNCQTTIASGATIGIGVSTLDGVHPSPDLHYAMAQVIDLSRLVA